MPPLDYNEEEEVSTKHKYLINQEQQLTNLKKTTSVRLEEEKKNQLTEQELHAKIKDEKFQGKPVRLDGKAITANQVKNIVLYYL